MNAYKEELQKSAVLLFYNRNIINHLIKDKYIKK